MSFTYFLRHFLYYRLLLNKGFAAISLRYSLIVDKIIDTTSYFSRVTGIRPDECASLSLSLLRGCARFAVKVARKSHRKRTHSYARTERKDKKERDTVGRREKEIAGAQMEVQAGCALGIPARKTRGGRTSKRTDGVGTEKFDHLSPPRSSLPRLVATWPAVTPFPAASDAAAVQRLHSHDRVPLVPPPRSSQNARVAVARNEIANRAYFYITER